MDTLHCSVRGELQDGLLVFLEALKEESQRTNELQVVIWGEQSLSVALRPHGWRSYPFWASSPNIEVAIGAPAPFPPVFIQTHSAYLHSRGADQAVAEISEWLEANVMRDEPVLGASRLDLYCDTQGWLPAVGDFDKFHCRAVRRRTYSVPAYDQAHLRGRRASGFVFGGGDLMGRCYDKTLELHSRGSEWPKTLWVDWDQDQPVWRVVMSSIEVSTRLVSHRGWASGRPHCLIPELVSPTLGRPPQTPSGGSCVELFSGALAAA